MPVEESPARRAKIITSEFVDAFVKQDLPKAPNKLRAVNQCILGLQDKLFAERLGREFFPLQATIGDIDPYAIGLTMEGTPDIYELGRFANLSDRLGLDPEGVTGTYDAITRKKKEIEQEYKHKRLLAGKPIHVPSRYYPEGGRGTEEARALMTKELAQLGINAKKEDVWMGYGGMDIIQRTTRALSTFMIREKGRKPLLLSPSVGFTMAISSAEKNGVDITYVPTSDLLNDELTSDRLITYFAQGGKVPDLMMVTPANNPTAQSSDPDKLRSVLQTMMQVNNDVVFMFDMAYMWTIPREKALAIMNVLKETGADKRAVFIVSESKKMGRPGTRIAAAVVNDEAIRDSVNLHGIMYADTMGNEPSFSGELDTLYQALSDETIIPDSTFDDLSALFQQRKRAFLDVLKEIDKDRRFFDDEIERVVVPGDEKPRLPDSIVQDIPLYLWLKLKKGVTAFDVLKELGIGGAPSEVFGPEGGDYDSTHLRLSMGFLSTSDILCKSKTVLNQWVAIKS